MSIQDQELSEETQALDLVDQRWTALYERARGNFGKLLIQRNAARDLAARLEQELAETRRRCQVLIHDWTTTGSMEHAAQLAEALELGAE